MTNEIIPLSAAIITRDEEKNLPDCLKSISFADDIVVIDSGSTDRTVEVAKEFGCRVFEEEWKGFGPQKNSAVEKCRHEWVLLIDADERASAEAGEEIRKILKGPDASAYRFRMKHYVGVKWIKHAGYWPDWHVRLVNRRKGSFAGTTHEKWVTTGRICDLNAHIAHHSFSNYADMLTSLDEYSTIIAGDFFASGKRANVFSPLYHGVGMFLKIYLLQRGFLAGFDGLVIALTKAGGSFFKYAKLLEMQRGEKG
ncbi:MAG TPA: glycosyltransferase family 2 protein [Thermodesulfovibrionales bacterium]|nr:glycosyltransferase family 2 protein [Thermodesulfovibrionales bacterium]